MTAEQPTPNTFAPARLCPNCGREHALVPVEPRPHEAGAVTARCQYCHVEQVRP